MLRGIGLHLDSVDTMNENALLKTTRRDFPTNDERQILPDRWYSVRSYEILTLDLWEPSPTRPCELFVAWKEVNGAVKQLKWLETEMIKVKISDYGPGFNRGSIEMGEDSVFYLEDMETGSIRVQMHVHDQWPENAPVETDATETSLGELPEDSNWDDMVDYSGA